VAEKNVLPFQRQKEKKGKARGLPSLVPSLFYAHMASASGTFIGFVFLFLMR